MSTPQAAVSLQIALDRIPLDRAERIAAGVCGVADWIEVGTSLIKRYGMAGVARIVAAAASTRAVHIRISSRTIILGGSLPAL